MSASPLPETSEIFLVPIDEIQISTDNVRTIRAEKNLDELAASIALHGLLQPVVLTGAQGHPPYSLISGQRRFLAHKEILGETHIRAVFAGELDQTQSLIRSLVENLQREELEFADTQKAVTALFEQLGSEQAVCDATGISKRRVREHLMIEARATPKIRGMLNDKLVSVMDVKRALRAAQDDLNKAEKLLELIIQNNPPAPVKRRLITYGNRQPNASAEEIFKKAGMPHIEQQIMLSLSDELIAALEAASGVLEMDPTEVAQKALADWLSEQGFTA